MSKKIFIAFEGIDGSGKSTQMKLLKEKLESTGNSVFSTFEPTKGPIGKMIRDIFNHKMEADHRTIAALFAADRLEHILDKKEGMLAKLDEGYIVLTDRYYLSSYAYHGTHMPMDWVMQTNALSAQLLKPDVHIFIDITAETGMQRLQASRGNLELYETLDNQKKTREKYFEAFEKVKDEEKVVIVDGERDPSAIAKEIWRAVDNIF